MGIRAFKAFARPFVMFIAASLVISCSLPTGFSQTAMMPVQKGMCYVTWTRDSFSSRYSDESLTKLSDLGVEFISLCVTQYQKTYDSTDIRKTGRTPTDQSLRHVIEKAHELGLKVMLKPHIDLIDKHDGTYWRADIGFVDEQDWDKWFREYERFITHYARMAEKYDVEIFCVGTELSFTAQKTDRWRTVIKEVRDRYSGKLVYAANWDNYQNIGFWDVLDYAGIDAYFPLTYETPPSMEDLRAGWNNWAHKIEVWQKKINRPVLFTEIGYASTSHAAYSPWKNGVMGNPDTDLQARCYQAFFETVWKKDWLAGAYWWKWDTNVHAGGEYNRYFTPQNKPAQDIIEANYKGLASDSTYAMAR